jgi:hypothetical protein
LRLNILPVAINVGLNLNMSIYNRSSFKGLVCFLVLIYLF